MDYYEALGIDENATQEQIKAAYRTLAKKYHPDVNDAPNAAAVFRLIQEAYETLSDPQKRKEYDDSDCEQEEQEQEQESANYSVHYTYSYEPVAVSSELERRKDIPLVDSLIAIAAVAGATNALIHIHIVFCILIGIAFSIVLAALFQTRVGWWVISIIYSAIWALLGGVIAGGLSNGDWIWFWAGYGLVFLLSLMQHRHKLDTKS